MTIGNSNCLRQRIDENMKLYMDALKSMKSIWKFRTQCVKLHEKLACSYLDLDGIIREGLLLDQEEVFGRKLTVMEVDEIVQEIMMKWIKGPDDFAGGQDSEPTHINQEPKTKIESEIDDEKSDEVQRSN